MLRAETNEEDKVFQVFATYWKGYETRDVELLKNTLSPVESHISWGTGKDEKYVGVTNFLRQVQRDFAQSEGAKFKFANKYIVIHGNSAWIALEVEPYVTIQGKVQRFDVLRTTAILQMEKGKWVIEHIHASWPYPHQDEGQSFPGK